MSRDWMIAVPIAVALATLGWWFTSNTEWREVTVQQPLKGEARSNRLYVAGKLVEALGGQVVKPTGLEALPPTNAVLILTARYWNLFPQRRDLLRQWVEAGGRLVLPVTLVGDDKDSEPWIGVVSRFHAPAAPKPGDEKSSQREGRFDWPAEPTPDFALNGDDDTEGDSVEAPNVQGHRHRRRLCPPFTETVKQDGAGPMLPGVSHYRVCDLRPRQTLLRRQSASGREPSTNGSSTSAPDPTSSASNPLLWSLDSPLGPVALRVGVGRGSVTVLTGDGPLSWRSPLRAHNGRFLVAVTQLRPSDTVWFIADEAGENLAGLMWRYGWPALLLLGLALALLMWRAMTRFGPMIAVPATARRSLAEQIRGSAEFLVRYRRGAVLLAAQVRAVIEVAQGSIQGWNQMDARARHAALARTVHVAPAEITRAVQMQATATAQDLAQAIALLESVRRQLLSDSSGAARSESVSRDTGRSGRGSNNGGRG